MKMRKLVFFLASLILLAGVLPVQGVSAASFTDVKEYEEEINYLVDKHIITGYKDGTFKPEYNLNRLNAVMMILREKGITVFTAPDPGFTDMDADTYGYEIASKAVAMGFISGKNAADGSKFFDPSGTLTRGQMAKILVLAYDLPINNSFTFTDMPSDVMTKGYISTLAAENITTGYPDGTFKPNGKISRQHYAVFMARLLEDLFKPKPEPDTTLPAPEPVPTPVTPDPVPQPSSGLYVIPGAPTSFKNCTLLREYYPEGVKKGHPAYAGTHDRDNDDWACER